MKITRRDFHTQENRLHLPSAPAAQAVFSVCAPQYSKDLATFSTLSI